ncbi:MAG: alanine--tRNA ligase [Acidobacteria bacterium]|nr:alanine--tRNA ligase [Acidobacteriota bacterium]
MTGHEIRQKFLEFFATNQHRIVKSSPLLPTNDPTLLFANAGMNQFKDTFLGLEKRDYSRAVTSQKCIRAGGKHNDLEEVGKTARHHTFFEMLGNFSFGDYFKEEAIVFAWDLLLKEFQLPLNRLWFSVYKDDDEALELWKKVGAPADRILKFGEKDNFWQMGNTGPCGPCSEIHYYMGEDLSKQRAEMVNGAGDTVMEIWNLVFMQFNRDEHGTLTPLPKPSVDTGMGLERISAVLQGVKSNYDTDLIRPILQFISELCSREYDPDTQEGMSMRVLADHARATAFAIADGILPGTNERNYVLRKIMRRAIYHGSHKLGISELFFHKITDFVTHMMGGAYPELLTARNLTSQVIQGEERRFRNTLRVCLPKFHDLVERHASQMPPYSELVRLYDTFGMPSDLIKVMLEQQGHQLDPVSFDQSFSAALEELQKTTQPVCAAPTQAKVKPIYQELAEQTKTNFTGYQGTELLETKIVALISKDEKVSELNASENEFDGEVILESTPFYAESGGQIGDTGILESQSALAKVLDTYSPVSGLSVHKVKVEKGSLKVGDKLAALVDTERRRRIMLNHTATHLLHAALREVLGLHVKQAGSLVAPDRLRFDFTHYAALTDTEINELERLVNEQIQRNSDVSKQEMGLEKALSSGAMALFGEKYSSQVRVVSVPGFSTELCGGTHVSATGDIGLLKIISDSSVAAGIRRIEAITGPGAIERYQQAYDILDGLAVNFKSGWQDIPSQIERLQTSLKLALSQVDTLKLKLATQSVTNVLEQAKTINNVKILAQKVEDLDRSGMRQLADNLGQKLGSSVVVLGMTEEDKAALLVRVSSDLTKKLNAGKIIKELAEIVGGKGGGRPDLAEAGGRDVAKLDDALGASYQSVEKMLTS